MQENAKTQSRVCFGLFEADLKSGELRKAGYRVKLQGLPFKVLTVLLENAGEVVTREELQARIWGPDVIVDFEHSLSNAIKKLREALGDSAENPRFIETLSRRGFRFIAPVGFTDVQSVKSADSVVDEPDEMARVQDPLHGKAAETAPDAASPARGWSRYLSPALWFGLGGLIVGVASLFWSAGRPSAVPPRIFQVTRDGTILSLDDNLFGSLSGFVTDGVHLFTPASDNGKVVLSQISMSTGTSQPIPLLSEIGAPGVEDISADGTKLLVRSSLASSAQQPLWVVTIDGGSTFRVSNILVQDATWMPDGKNILYTSGNQLAEVSPDGGRSTVIATVAGRAFWPRWSADGKVLRFTIIDAVNHTSSLWEISQGESVAHPILKSWSNSVHPCCGVWTADGRYFVFQATQDGYTDLWKVNASLNSTPVRVTNGPLSYRSPAPGREGEQIFFIGQDRRSLLEHYDSERKEYVPQQGFLAAAGLIRFSRDGRWVAWVDPSQRLWRARADGTDKVMLTPASMQVSLVSWSPDNARLAFMAREPLQPWQIYMVSTDGGTPERLLQEDRNIGDPSFSADGRYLVFGTVAELMEEMKTPRSLKIMDLATHHVTEIVHSQGMFSPAWSPDGRFISAITLDQNKLMLYDTQAMTWKVLAVTSAAYPVWSKDSKSIYIYAYQAENRPVRRVSVPDGRVEDIANINNFRGNIMRVDFSGITPDDVLLMHAEISSGNLYTMDLGQK